MPRKIFYLQLLQKYTENVCVIHRENEKNKTYTYKDIIETVLLVKQRFQELDIPSSVGFALKLTESHTPGSIVLLLAILNHHCHFYPLSESDISEHDLLKSGSNYLICNDENKDSRSTLLFLAKVSILGETFNLSKITNRKFFFPKDMCYTLTTSGSTGEPKLVHVPFSCIEPNIVALSDLFEVTSSDVIFLGTPITFDPFVVELFTALACGAALLITTSEIRLDPQKLISILWQDSCKNHAVTILQTTPSLFRLFGEQSIRNEIFAENSSLRILILGGEEFPKPIEFENWIPKNHKIRTRIFNIYGITELSCWASIYECKDLRNLKKIPLGAAIDSQTILKVKQIAEEETDDQIEESIERGELLVGSASRKTFIPQEGSSWCAANKEILYRPTGDFVEIGKDGEIFYLGRLNNVVKRFGKRLSLDILEKKIESHFISTQNVKVVCLWDQSKKILTCCLRMSQQEDDKHDKTFKEIKASILAHLEKHEKPDRFLKINQIILNKHGKLDRWKLLEEINSYNLIQPIDIFKRFLKEILLIEVPKLRRNENKRIKLDKDRIESLQKSFLDAGGTSFQALSLATEISESLPSSYEQRDLLEKLLNPQTTLENILNFLENIEVKETPDLGLGNEIVKKSSSLKSKNLQFLWRVDMKKCIDATVSVDIEKHFICIGSHSHLLLTIDASNGKEISRLTLKDRIECDVAFISKDMALVGCNAGNLYAFNVGSGALEWTINVGQKVKAKPLIIQENLAIVGCYGENFNCICFDLKTQQIKWKKKIGHKPIFSSPTQFDEATAIICTLDGSYERLEMNSGKALWTQCCDSPIFSTPAILRSLNEFVFAEVSGRVHLSSAANGEILHSFIAPGNIFSSLTLHITDDDPCYRIIFGCHDHNVYCLNYRQNISERDSHEKCFQLSWKCNFDSPIYATPFVVRSNESTFVVICSTKGLLSVLDLADGNALATHDLQAEVFSSPRCIKLSGEDFRVYFGCRDNFLYCFRFCEENVNNKK